MLDTRLDINPMKIPRHQENFRCYKSDRALWEKASELVGKPRAAWIKDTLNTETKIIVRALGKAKGPSRSSGAKA